MTPTCTARPFGAFFHGDSHIYSNQRNDTTVFGYDIQFNRTK